jgi:hypothetical protein
MEISKGLVPGASAENKNSVDLIVLNMFSKVI